MENQHSLRACQHCFGAVASASLLLALSGGWAVAEAFAHALPESIPFVRRQLPAAFLHAPSTVGAAGTVKSKSAEKDAAERQKSKRLPEGNQAPAEKGRQQPIPQFRHYFAADYGE